MTHMAPMGEREMAHREGGVCGGEALGWWLPVYSSLPFLPVGVSLSPNKLPACFGLPELLSLICIQGNQARS